MFHTLRDALGVIREAIGIRNALGYLLVILLAAPFLIAFLICAIPFWLLGTVVSWIRGTFLGVGTQLDDPVFGPITFEGDSSWIARQELPSLSGSYHIC